MKIERKNIIELIGKRANAYHSCIITCFSLDFAYFEERVLPSLRVANIKNVNLFCDGYYLETAQEFVSGKEFKHNKTYNFVPVYEKGVFHPKIIFLAGEKNGLLIIGSGNVTSSGLSTNDEIWAAFHINTVDTENAMVFSQVWSYLETLFSNARGFIPEKLNWFRKYAPWINNLPKAVDDFRFSDSDIDFSFLFNSENNSTYTQIKKKVKLEKLLSVTAISPFYDKNGSAIVKILEDFKPEKFNCIVESNDGVLPLDLPEKQKEFINFYDWKDCIGDFDESRNRLHAKMLHFEFEDSEALFLGSANITEAALGTSGTASNSESGILIQRKSVKSNWLKELGVKIPKNCTDLKNYNSPLASLSESLPRRPFSNRILYSEINGSVLTIFLKKVQNISCKLLILDRNEVSTLVELPKIETEKIAVRVKPDEVFRVALMDENENQITNFSFVHRVESLANTNPDPKFADLSNMLNEDYPNFEGISQLLKHIDFSFADQEDYERKKHNFAQREHTRVKDEKRIDYKIADIADFVRTYDDYSTERNVLNGSNHLIFSKLSGLLKFHQSEQSYEDDLEQMLFIDEEQQGEGSELKTKSNHNNSENEVRLIKDYFRKLNRGLENQVKGFYEEKSNNWKSLVLVDISLLSNILISLELIIIFQGKNTTEEKPMFIGGDISSVVDPTTIKGYLASTLGYFLMLCHSGFKNYDLESLAIKLEEKKVDTFCRILFIACNQKWKESEINILETIIFDSLYYLKKTVSSIEEVKQAIEKLRSDSNYVSPYFDDNLTVFLGYVEFYQDWYKNYKNMDLRKRNLIVETTELNSGEIIFGSKIGFCIFSRLNSSEENFCKVSLMRVGFPTENKFIIDNFNYGKSAVVLEK